MLVMGFLALNGCEDAQVEVVERDLLPSEFPADFTPPNDYLTGQKLDGWEEVLVKLYIHLLFLSTGMHIQLIIGKPWLLILQKMVIHGMSFGH